MDMVTTGFIRVEDPVPAEALDTIHNLGHNSLILRLAFTLNHLSRWITPVHDADKLERARYRGEPTPKELIIRLREYEELIYPRMFLIAHRPSANLDVLGEPEVSPRQREYDERDPTVVVMARFRRLRQTSTALLRALPDDAWDLRGYSRDGLQGTIRSMADALAIHDYRVLRALDQTLDLVGAREGLAANQKASLDEMLQLVPEHVDITP